VTHTRRTPLPSGHTAPAAAGRHTPRPLAWRTTATLVVLLAILPAWAAATTLYVDQNQAQCTDTGPATELQPLCTIGAAADQVQPGDTVVVRPGTYAEQVEIAATGTSSAPIVFTADSGVTVTGQAHGFDLSGSSWLTLEGFTLEATSNDAIRAWLVSHLTLANNQVLSAGGEGFDVRDCGDVTLADNVVQESSGVGILIKYCSQVSLTHNAVSGAGEPIQGQNKKGIVLNGSTECVVADNLTEANSDAGLYVSNGSTGLQLRGNTSRYKARQYTRAAAGIDLRGSSGNTIEANRCYDNEDSGINVRNDAPDNLVVNNVSYHNGDHGIDFLRAPNGRIIGNTVYANVRRGLEIEGGSAGMTVANNLCVDNGKANIRTSADAAPGSVADYNVVYRSTPGVLYEWADVNYATLAALRSAHPELEVHGVEGDPLWASPSEGDFHLRAGSPAIDSADSGVSGALGYDVEGNGRVDDAGTPDTGAGPRAYDDRGAFEFIVQP
jgi:parallel beta-helix repeat protein